MKIKAILPACLLLVGVALPGNGTWIADAANAKITFSVAGPMGKVDGNFSHLKATIVFDENNLALCKIHATVDVNTIETGIALRNKDLSDKEEWFNGAKYPQITIQSKAVEKVGKGYKLTADLTIKNVTKQVEIPFTYAPLGAGGVFKAGFTLNRLDYALGTSGMVGKEVTVNIDVPVTR